MRTATNTLSPLDQRSIAALLERYVSWREECSAVRQEYQAWADADRDHRGLAYAGYVAALDREEHAALAYAEQSELVSRISLR
jgi:hypothetical protein